MIILLLSSRCLQSKKELIQLCWRIKINWQCHEFRLNNNPLSNTERKKWCIGQKEIYRIIFIFDFITCTVDVKANLHTWKKKNCKWCPFLYKKKLTKLFWYLVARHVYCRRKGESTHLKKKLKMWPDFLKF